MIIVYKAKVILGGDEKVWFICNTYDELRERIVKEENIRRKEAGIDIEVLPNNIMLSLSRHKSEHGYIFIDNKIDELSSKIDPLTMTWLKLYDAEVFGMFREVTPSECRMLNILKNIEFIYPKVYPIRFKMSTGSDSMDEDIVIGYTTNKESAEWTLKEVGPGIYYEPNPQYSAIEVENLGKAINALTNHYQSIVAYTTKKGEEEIDNDSSIQI